MTRYTACHFVQVVSKIDVRVTCSFLILPSENHMAFYYRSYRRRYGRRRSYPRRSYSYSTRRAAPRVRRRRATTTRRKTVKADCKCPPGALDPGQKFLLAQADPFEQKVLGAKIPDSNTIPSVPVCISELRSLTLPGTNPDLPQCYAFLPGFTNGIVVSVNNNPSSWQWAGAFGGTLSWGKASDFRSSFESTRPVAHGLRISCPLAPTSTTGFVHLAVAVETFDGVTSWPYATNVADMSGYSWYKRVTLASLTQSPLTIINKYIDETAFRYSSASTPGYANATPMEFHTPWSWGALMVAIEGHPVGVPPLQFEMILHHESIPKNTSVLLGSTAAEYSPSVLGSASHMVANSDFAHTEDQQESHIRNSLSTAFQSGVSQAGNVAMERIILPAAQSLGYNLAGRAISAGLSFVAGRGISGVNSSPNRLALTR